MFDLQLRVGRLLEVTAGGSFTVEELRDFRTQFAGVLARTSGLLVIVVDWRRTVSIDPDAFPVLIGIMRSDNPRLERAAHLTPGGRVGQDVQNVADASRNASRRTFTDSDELLSWVEEALTPREMESLRHFVGLEVPALSA
jgi:hypothetical protein